MSDKRPDPSNPLTGWGRARSQALTRGWAPATFPGHPGTESEMEKKNHHFLDRLIGRHVIARCTGAGVHAGVLVAAHDDRSSVSLTNARRLWTWRAKDGVALSGVAIHGIVAADSIVDTMVPEIALMGVVELIPTTDAARETIDAA